MTVAETDLPPGWTKVALGTVSSEPDQHVPADDEAFAYIDIGSIDRNAKVIREPQRMLGKDAPSRARKKVVAGDTLVSMTRPNLNAVALVPDALDGQIASTGFDVLRPARGIDPRWLAYLVRTDEFVGAMSELVRGALYPAVRTKDVRGFVAPLAPAAEQTRIADQLDTLLARIQACQDRLETIPALLKRFRQAVLDAAIDGSLTAEWREGRSSPDWAESTVGACGLVSGGLTKNSRRESAPLRRPYLRVANVQAGRLELDDVAEIGLTEAEFTKTSLRPGDLLIVEGNGSLEQVGRVAIWSGEIEHCVHQNHLIRWRSNGPSPHWVLTWLLASTGRSALMERASTTTGLYTLSISKVSSVPIRLPGYEEQEEIIRRVSALHQFAERTFQRCSKAVAHSQRLGSLTLSKAFRGELVPQDPNDEPASALLARIGAQRNGPTDTASARTTRRGRPPRAPKETATMTKSRQDDDVLGKPYLAGHLRRIGTPASAESLFKAAELPVADFYKQLAWEVAQGHVKDNQTTLEPGHAAG